MKAVIITSGTTTLADGTTVPQTQVVADSAISRDTMPLFLPDLPFQWQAQICMALRVGRLGKHVSQKFANRYIEAIGAVCMLQGSPVEQYRQSGIASIIDSAVTTGAFIDYDSSVPYYTLTVNGIDTTLDITPSDIDKAIVDVSVASTIKSGDLIILAQSGYTAPLIPDTYINAQLNGQSALHLKVK